MAVRENSFLEASKYLKESRLNSENKRNSIIQERLNKKEEFSKKYRDIRESRQERERFHGEMLEAAKNNNFATVLKGIYIGALEANSLTDNGIILAENLVDSWIKEKGGASAILNECKNRTYLLSRISEIVQEASDDDVKEVEDVDKDKKEEDKKEDNKKEKEEKPKEKEEDKKEKKDKKDDIDIDKKLDGDDDLDIEDDDEDEEEEKEGDKKSEKEEKKEKESENEDEEDDDKEDKKEEKSDPLNITDIDGDGDEDESDIAEDIVDDIDDTAEEKSSIDGEGTDNKGKIFEELEKEDDVKKAVELIKQRVADAEESFIKRNAEDKKKVDELLSKISDNVKTVEDLSEDDPDKAKVAQEAARLNNIKIKEITENRPLTVLEKMTRKLSSSIIKDSSVREQYVTESGELDTYLIVESAKVMYGFLETISTLQLEKVDAAYIQKVLEEM